MKQYFKTTITFVLFLGIADIIHAEVRYNFIDLGTLGGKNSVSYSINNAGNIVGLADLATGAGNFQYRATLFDPTGNKNNINLGIMPNYSYSQATAINDNGQIVGATYGSVTTATVFDSTGQGNNINLGGLNQSSHNYVNCINNNGKIGGGAGSRAAIFDITGNGNNIDLGVEGFVTSINNFDKAVGYSNYYPRRNALLFDISGNGANINLGWDWNVIGWESIAEAINDQSQVVGWVIKGQTGGYPVIFDISGNQNNIVLSTLNGMASDINNNGQIVGWLQTTKGQTATLFDETVSGNNIDLNTVTYNLNGMYLQFAYEINDNGWIVGQATAPDNTFHAFVLTPIPEPTSLLLLAIGGLLIRKRTF